jgi:hypothetical protein
VAQAKVITQAVQRRGHDPELLMKIMILPRGSGNRGLCRRLAREAKIHPVLAEHVSRVKVGSSTVWVYLRPSLRLTAQLGIMMLERANRAADAQDVPGQLPLFAT